MKRIALIAVVVFTLGAFVPIASGRPSKDVAAINTGSVLSATARFYGDRVHFTLHYVVGFDDQCVSDGYGGWDNFNCYGLVSNDADLDLTIYRTSPTWANVFSDTTFGTHGLAASDVYGTYQLGFNCRYRRHGYSQNFKAVFRLFSPIDDRVLAVTTSIFHETCP